MHRPFFSSLSVIVFCAKWQINNLNNNSSTETAWLQILIEKGIVAGVVSIYNTVNQMSVKEEKCSLKTYLNEETVNSRGSAHFSYYMGMIQLQENLSRGAGSIYCYQRGLELKIPDSHKSFPVLLTRLGGIFRPLEHKWKTSSVAMHIGYFLLSCSISPLQYYDELLLWLYVCFAHTLARQVPQCLGYTTFRPKP